MGVHRGWFLFSKKKKEGFRCCWKRGSFLASFLCCSLVQSRQGKKEGVRFFFFLLVFKRELLRGWQGEKPKRRREPFRFESVLALEERREW